MSLFEQYMEALVPRHGAKSFVGFLSHEIHFRDLLSRSLFIRLIAMRTLQSCRISGLGRGFEAYDEEENSLDEDG